MAVHFILLFCWLQRFPLFIREVCFCPWLEALSASSAGALSVGLRSNPVMCTISALTWELETHKMFYIYPTWHSIISSCMSAYASVPEKKPSKAKKRLPLVLIVYFPLYEFVIHVVLHLMLLSEKLSHAVAWCPTKAFIGWRFCDIAGSHINGIFTLKLCFTIIMLLHS